VPELPDVAVYVEALRPRVEGKRFRRARVAGPFFLRTYEPPLEECEGKQVTGVRRVGKRIVLSLEADLFLVFHLMIAGRLHWKEGAAGTGGRNVLATFAFESGTLVVTEAGSKKRASLHVVRGVEELRRLDPGGIEPLEASLDEFRAALLRENHTLKRALSDPRLFSGIGNAYSDEILHRARLSPLGMTRKLGDDEVAGLHRATREVLNAALDRLREEAAGGFPEGVTAFRTWMSVHGRYRKTCPVCGSPVQRIRYAENETNYCPGCQTGGRILADRSLSRLLKDDWPPEALGPRP